MFEIDFEAYKSWMCVKLIKIYDFVRCRILNMYLVLLILLFKTYQNYMTYNISTSQNTCLFKSLKDISLFYHLLYQKLCAYFELHI